MSPIQEDFLHFIWRTLRFNVTHLTTTCGQQLQLIHPGTWNHNQGPDFLDGNVMIGEVRWRGHIELHIHSNEWYHHKHHNDPNYNNVVLHVVLYGSEKPIIREDGTSIPELELNGRIAPYLFEAYHDLVTSSQMIPCASLIETVKPFHLYRWIDRLAIERIATKASVLKDRIEELNDWDQLIWEELAAMMGGTVNKEAFRQVAMRVPYKWMTIYREKPLWLEALLYGASGLLDGKIGSDSYVKELASIWIFLQKKHQITTESKIAVRFSRMRPASMPTIRLAQLIGLIRIFPRLTQLLLPEYRLRFMQEEIDVSPYWHTHYIFERETAFTHKFLGKAQKNILVINVLIPLAYLYHQAHGKTALAELVENGLSTIPAEKNKITRLFDTWGISAKNAAQSQGVIQLKKHYCDKKRCLECEIGYQLLKKSG